MTSSLATLMSSSASCSNSFSRVVGYVFCGDIPPGSRIDNALYYPVLRIL